MELGLKSGDSFGVVAKKLKWTLLAKGRFLKVTKSRHWATLQLIDQYLNQAASLTKKILSFQENLNVCSQWTK